MSLVFTFDDGPGPQTEELAGYLAEQKIPATFFMVGKHVRGNPEAVTRLRELGHRIGNHTENHLHLTNSSVSDRQALAEFLETDKLLQELGVPAPYYFRPPYGGWNGHLAHVFRDLPLANPAGWDIDGRDHALWHDHKSAEACADSYLRAIEKRKAGIILFHDYSADDARAAQANRVCDMIRLLVPRLRKKGYGFRSLEDPIVPADK